MTHGRRGLLLRRIAALEARLGFSGRCADCGGRHTGERLPLAVIDAALAGESLSLCACAPCCPSLHRCFARAWPVSGGEAD